MNDLTKLIAAAGAGAAAMHLYMNYQAGEAQRAALARRNPVQLLTDTVSTAYQGLEPATQMQGMHGMQGMQGHMPMPSPRGGFYGHSGMRQSAPGNPHAPVVIPARRPGAGMAPPPPEPVSESSSGEGLENYDDGNTMGGQRF